MKPLILLILLAASVFGQERYVKPLDEAPQDPSFLAFRTKLIAAAERKDAKYILSIVDRNIKNGFGGEDGIVKFRNGWKLESARSEFWAEFLLVMKNGGSFDGDGAKRLSFFSAPYLFSSWPGDLDAFEYFAIFGYDVNLRKEPNIRSEVVAKLSYNVVKIEPETVPKSGKSEYPDWWQVTTLGGLKGFVKREYIRSSIAHRAGFEKKRGVWKMTFFLAGD